MSETPQTTPPASPEKRESLLKLNPARITLLVLGAIILLYTASALLGGLTNYEQMKEAAQYAKAAKAAAQPTPEAAPAPVVPATPTN